MKRLADRSAHLRKAGHNQQFLNLVQKFDAPARPVFPDWFVTVAFYIALQYVDARLADMKMHPDDHYERDRMVAAHLRAVSDEYQFLKTKSEFARYFPDSEQKISPVMVKKCLDLALLIFSKI